jgi:hypothetical protein
MTSLLEEIHQLIADRNDLEEIQKSTGFAVRSVHPDATGGGRCQVWFFLTSDDRPLAFCYKASRLSFSRDRFSYGFAKLRRSGLVENRDSLDEILVWLREGFRPSVRPPCILRAVNFEIPAEIDLGGSP